MLPRSQRLSVAEFNQIMAKGRITHSPLFIIQSLKLDLAERTKVSTVAPQKIFKKAVQRNKLRRQMYEAVQPLYVDMRSHMRVAVFAKAAALEADFAMIKNGIKEIFVKAGIMK